MNANAVLDMIGDAKDTYVWDAQQVRNGNVTCNKKKISIKRMWFIAAIIAMILTLVGCAIVYVLRLQDFEIGSQTTTKEVWSDDGMELLGEETIPQQVFTLNGLKGTASYQASKEWFDFLQSYDPDKQIKLSTWDNCPEFPEKYDAYYPYSQEMVDKIDAIADKYNLDLLGDCAGLGLFMQDMTPAFDVTGIDSLLRKESDARIKTIAHCSVYESGSLGFSFDMTMPEGEDQWPHPMHNSLYFMKKDCFDPSYIVLNEADTWKEWNYTTSSGNNVLILHSDDSVNAWILHDRKDAMIAVRVEGVYEAANNVDGKTWWDVYVMEPRHMEAVADAIDFDMQPNINFSLALKEQARLNALWETMN